MEPDLFDSELVLQEQFKSLGVSVYPVHEAVGSALAIVSFADASRRGAESEMNWMQDLDEARESAKKEGDLVLYIQLVDHSYYGLKLTNSPERLDQWDGSVGAVLICSRKEWDQAWGGKKLFTEENVMQIVGEDVDFLEHCMNGWLWEVDYEIDGECSVSGPFLDEEEARKSITDDGHPELCFEEKDFDARYTLSGAETEISRSKDGEWTLQVKCDDEVRRVIGGFESEAEAQKRADELFQGTNVSIVSSSQSKGFHR